MEKAIELDRLTLADIIVQIIGCDIGGQGRRILVRSNAAYIQFHRHGRIRSVDQNDDNGVVEHVRGAH